MTVVYSMDGAVVGCENQEQGQENRTEREAKG